MVVTVIKTSYQKFQREIISDRDYGYYSNERFKETLISELSKVAWKTMITVLIGLHRNYKRGN